MDEKNNHSEDAARYFSIPLYKGQQNESKESYDKRVLRYKCSQLTLVRGSVTWGIHSLNIITDFSEN